MNVGISLSKQPRAYLLGTAHIFTKPHPYLHSRMSEIGGVGIDGGGVGCSQVLPVGNYSTDTREVGETHMHLLSKFLKEGGKWHCGIAPLKAIELASAPCMSPLGSGQWL